MVFKNLSIRRKLFLGLVSLVLILVLGLVYLMQSYFTFQESFENLDREVNELSQILQIQEYNSDRNEAFYAQFSQNDTSFKLVYEAATQEMFTLLSGLLENGDTDFSAELQEFKTYFEEQVAFEKSAASVQVLYDSYYLEEKEKAEFVLDSVVTKLRRGIVNDVSANRQRLLSTQVNVISVSLVLFFSIFIFSFFVSTYFLDNIDRMVKTANAIASGQIDRRMEVKSRDELGQFAASFNSMADALQKSYRDLEGKVLEKTQELGHTVSDLAKKNQEMEENKMAMINLLEDLDRTKFLVEQEKAKDESILSSIGDGVIAVDGVGKILMFNKAAENLLGKPRDDVLNKSFIEYFQFLNKDGEAMQADEDPLRQVLISGKKLRSNDFFFRTAEQNIFPISATISPIYFREGLLGVILVFREISKEKDVERMKNEFVSLASHQLRTPLTAMKWFSEMLVDGQVGELNSQQKDFIRNIQSSNERMIELVEALLTISRLESGKIIVEPALSDFSDLVKEVLIEVNPRASLKRQKVEFFSDPHLSKIEMDPKLIRQVISNLLTNAIKYSPEGGKVEVRVREDQDGLRCEVHDTGFGIPKDQQDRIFERFFRGSNVATVEGGAGTGLGLYLVKLMVEASGGKLGFESEENKGSTFWFTLPLNGPSGLEHKKSV